MPTITNDNPTVPATNANEILDTNEEKDALLSFQLRARLAEIHFALIWKVMPSLGWKYSSNGHYHSPCLNGGADLGTSKEAMEQLDFCALKHLRFRNDSDQSRSTATGSNPKGNRDDDAASLSLCKLQNVRKALLTAIFYKCRETNDPLPCFYFDEVDETLEKIDPDRIGKKNVGRPSRSASSGRQGHTGNDASSRSATANEKGTEEYLGAKKKKNKLQKSSKVNLGDGKLKWPSARDCVEAAKAAAAKKNGPRLELAREKNDQFLDNCGADWKFLLNTNHSLLLHGVGSKKRLLDNFAATQLRSHGDILTFNGYDPSINITQILDVLVTLFLNGVEPSSAPINQVTAEDRECEIGLLRTPNQLTSIVVRRAIAIAKVLGGRHPRPIYLVIHNIDGIGLRNEDAQRALSVLMIHSNIVDCPKGGPVVEAKRVVRIVASTDHVDAPMLLWDLETMNNYSWIWKEINTHEPYFDEIRIGIKEGTRKIKSSQQEKLDFVFMKKVLKSIAPKHTAILKELAKMQLASGKPNTLLGDYEYVNLAEWKQICFKTAFIVTKDSEFDSMVRELCDHNMVQRLDDSSVGISYVCIPTKKDKVREILKSAFG